MACTEVPNQIKYVLHGLYRGAKPNKICFSPQSHWLSHRLYIYVQTLPATNTLYINKVHVNNQVIPVVRIINGNLYSENDNVLS
jgi:hypothetical protein